MSRFFVTKKSTGSHNGFLAHLREPSRLVLLCVRYERLRLHVERVSHIDAFRRVNMTWDDHVNQHGSH